MLEFQESHRQRLSVAADDFGISPCANRNTLYLISMGKISRVGVMAFGEMSEKEILELVRSGAKLDVHLDILHKFDNDREKRNGSISRIIGFLVKIITGSISRKKITADWEKQIEKFHSIFGKYPDGINSHEHVHFFPPFFKSALYLKEKYNIPYIRFGEIISLEHHTINAYIIHLLKIINKKACSKGNCVSSDFLVSLDWINDMEAFLKNLPEGNIEIVCHPEIAEDFVKIKEFF